MLVGEKGLTCAGGKLFSFFRVMLREIVGSIFLSRRLFFSLTEGISFSHGGYFYLSQSAQSSRRFLAHISSPQKASGIQRTQSVLAKIGCKAL